MQLLDLYNIIDDLLDIRDAITIQICRLKRKRRLSEYYQTSQSPTAKQKEYKCGCKVQQQQEQKQQNNKKQITIIQHQYCHKHLHYLKTKQILETELTKINQELASITKKENEI